MYFGYMWKPWARQQIEEEEKESLTCIRVAMYNIFKQICNLITFYGLGAKFNEKVMKIKISNKMPKIIDDLTNVVNKKVDNVENVKNVENFKKLKWLKRLKSHRGKYLLDIFEMQS